MSDVIVTLSDVRKHAADIFPIVDYCYGGRAEGEKVQEFRRWIMRFVKSVVPMSGPTRIGLISSVNVRSERWFDDLTKAKQKGNGG
ncbi:MAG TPA: hypothetical protein VMW36_04930 [Patescibacteria group bacterium]|nr:hypothetical protein [Patescibacteria group bacterium]